MPRQAILLPQRFPNPRPTGPSLPRGRRAAPSPHLILGSAVNRRVRPCFSLRQRGCYGKQQQPAKHFSANAVLSQRLWLGANSTSPLLPQEMFSRVREEELRESMCLLGLAFPGSMLASWVHPPGRTKQTQRQPCSSVCSLGWFCEHTTISRCRHRLACCSGAPADSRTRPVLSPQGRRRDRIPAPARALNRELWGTVPTPSP